MAQLRQENQTLRVSVALLEREDMELTDLDHQTPHETPCPVTPSTTIVQYFSDSASQDKDSHNGNINLNTESESEPDPFRQWNHIPRIALTTAQSTFDAASQEAYHILQGENEWLRQQYQMLQDRVTSLSQENMEVHEFAKTETDLAKSLEEKATQIEQSMQEMRAMLAKTEDKTADEGLKQLEDQKRLLKFQMDIMRRQVAADKKMKAIMVRHRGQSE
ncbi:hypothetical protein BGX23_004772 [Mortierella sp. AD031]|nr:hypothetical protein BGX23_004772 [Mortierella sp. AD031]